MPGHFTHPVSLLVCSLEVEFQSQARCQATSHLVSRMTYMPVSHVSISSEMPGHFTHSPTSQPRSAISAFQSQARCQATSHPTCVSVPALHNPGFNLKRDARPLHTLTDEPGRARGYL